MVQRGLQRRAGPLFRIRSFWACLSELTYPQWISERRIEKLNRKERQLTIRIRISKPKRGARFRDGKIAPPLPTFSPQIPVSELIIDRRIARHRVPSLPSLLSMQVGG